LLLQELNSLFSPAEFRAHRQLERGSRSNADPGKPSAAAMTPKANQRCSGCGFLFDTVMPWGAINVFCFAQTRRWRQP
jgi:hypothetical protein